MSWSLDFISEEDFRKYIDPIIVFLDKTVYQSSLDTMIENDIYYFHQGILQCINNCHVPDKGEEGGWDLIYHCDEGIKLADGEVVHTIYVVMKNKLKTMNSASTRDTYIKMQHKLLLEDDCSCFLVEANARKSQDIKWETSVNGIKISHERIRRVSMDKFYAIVTGEENAYHKMCLELQGVIKDIEKR